MQLLPCIRWPVVGPSLISLRSRGRPCFGELLEEGRQFRQSPPQMRFGVTESNAEEPLTTELVARDDERAVLHSQTLGELHRRDSQIVTDECDRTCVRRSKSEAAAEGGDPRRQDFEVVCEDTSGPREDSFPDFRLQCPRRELVAQYNSAKLAKSLGNCRRTV